MRVCVNVREEQYRDDAMEVGDAGAEVISATLIASAEEVRITGSVADSTRDERGGGRDHSDSCPTVWA